GRRNRRNASGVRTLARSLGTGCGHRPHRCRRGAGHRPPTSVILIMNMIKRLALATLVLAAAATAFAAEKQVLSETYTIDRKYRSMEGPGSLQRIYLGDPDNPELLWITGVHTEMVGEDGSTPQLPELMCHVNIDLDPARHQTLFNLRRATSTRLVTLSQGMLNVTLPPGFGFPISSNEPLVLYTQVLNHNIEQPKNMKVRHRVTFE